MGADNLNHTAARRWDRHAPRGQWFDFWTDERLDGGREIDRPVDLETMPLHFRAGAILPFGPIKQYVEDPIDGPLSITIYPGADGAFDLYEDDGKTFDYRKGAWMRTQMVWSDAARRLTVRLAPGSRILLPPSRVLDVRVAGKPEMPRVLQGGLTRVIDVRIAGSQATRRVEFAGTPVEVQW